MAEPLIPQFAARPQGGGSAAVNDPAAFTRSSTCSPVDARGGIWRPLRSDGPADSPSGSNPEYSNDSTSRYWTTSAVPVNSTGRQRDEDAVSVRAKKGGSLTGPSPFDRGKKGSKIHVLSDANGIPLVVDVSAANTHDSTLLQSMVNAIPTVKSRRGPRSRRPGKLRVDKGYDYDKHRRWLREHGIVPRIVRRGIERNDRLGRYRRKIERTIAWLTGYRRLTIRYERHGVHFAGFLYLAAALTCFKKLPT